MMNAELVGAASATSLALDPSQGRLVASGSPPHHFARGAKRICPPCAVGERGGTLL